jgi:hypothetical protein
MRTATAHIACLLKPATLGRARLKPHWREPLWPTGGSEPCRAFNLKIQRALNWCRISWALVCDEENAEALALPPGTAVAGTVNPQLEQQPTDVNSIERWLEDVLAANPAIKRHFNGKAIHPQPLAAG